MVLDWLLLANTCILMPLSVLWSLATPRRRARLEASGGLRPGWLIVAFAPIALLAALDLRGVHLRALFLVGMVPLIWLGQRERQRLQSVPDDELSPRMRAVRDQPAGSPFNPFTIWPRMKHLWTHTYGRTAREEQKAWERAKGLR